MFSTNNWVWEALEVLLMQLFHVAWRTQNQLKINALKLCPLICTLLLGTGIPGFLSYALIQLYTCKVHKWFTENF